ncbi:MAG: type II toxin-antitoxin system PemK/MazF family toxin [Gammaproteobacteria bacterium]|nr:type II toxin-antitoxin system PemK/MazF family toxin [Gammaproteobacteria bacterium]
MPNTTNFKFGQIVLVRFPFTDQRGSKQRPAVVISSTGYNRARPDIILMAVTSQIRAKTEFGEAVIEDWQAAGLLKPSAIKPIVFTAEKTIIKKTLGQLGDKDQKGLRAIVETVIG